MDRVSDDIRIGLAPLDERERVARLVDQINFWEEQRKLSKPAQTPPSPKPKRKPAEPMIVRTIRAVRQWLTDIERKTRPT